MHFRSFDYLVLMSLTIAIYWVIPGRRVRNGFLLIVSYVFYGYIHPWYCTIVFVSTGIDYFCALMIARSPQARKSYLHLSILTNLTILGYFKYFNFFLDNFIEVFARFGFAIDGPHWQVVLPVGISFYTFQSMAYTIDVYRGEIRARQSFIDVALFVAFFPQLVAGPIERAKDLLSQLEVSGSFRLDMLARGLPLILFGYVKKLVVADNLAPIIDQIYRHDETTPLLIGASGIWALLQVYADFSAYTDIARGTAFFLGIELKENFRSPLLAWSMVEFWRRWHITLSIWMRDYVFIPLGGSRSNNPLKRIVVVLATFGLAGLWHGASWKFILWGLYLGLLVVVYHACGLRGDWKPRTKTGHFLAVGLTLSLISASMPMFMCSDLSWFLKVRWIIGGIEAYTYGLVFLALVPLIALYIFPLLVIHLIVAYGQKMVLVRNILFGILIIFLLLARENEYQFVYFKF